MQEACYCGRSGELEDRMPVVCEDGERALRCPNEKCGHVDRLKWLPEEARTRALDEAQRRRSERRGDPEAA